MTDPHLDAAEFPGQSPIGVLRSSVFFGVVSVVLFATAPLRAQQTYVVTIAANRYHRLGDKQNLRYCANDASQVVERLRARNRIVGDDHVLSLSPDALDEKLLPTRDNIVAQVPRFLAQASVHDTIIVFAALHGARVKNSSTGQLEGYLLPADVDPRKVPDSLISLEWLREQLQQTPAKTVVLFLDACHSGAVGTEVTANLVTLSTRDVEQIFHQPVAGKTTADKSIYTLVSCSEDESSIEWSEFKQGVFAYWLCQGLDGAADVDGDAVVSMDELFRFVELEVPRTAAYLRQRTGKPLKQRPQRFLLGSVHGDLKLFPLHPEPATKTLERLTGLVDAVIRNHLRGLDVAGRAPRVSVLEFSSRTNEDRELRGALGSLGSISRDVIERGLVDRISDTDEQPAYRVVLEESLRPALREVKLEEVLSGKLSPAVQPTSAPQVDAIVLGTFFRKGHRPGGAGPDRLQFEVQLFDLHQTLPVGRISITMLVDQELWSLLGGSRDDRQSMAPAVVQPDDPANITDLQQIAPAPKVGNWNADADRKHPLRDPKNCSLGVSILQGPPDGEKRPVEWLAENPHDANLLAFGVRRGTGLEIHLENQTDDWLAVIALVDGHNVIGRKRTLPSQARYWLLPPRRRGIIDQWLDDDAKSATKADQGDFQQIAGRKFLVIDPPASIAGQKGFTAELGEIRLIVFGTTIVPSDQVSRNVTVQPSVGIGEGQRSDNVFPVYRNRKIDLAREMANYVIHYIEQPVAK